MKNAKHDTKMRSRRLEVPAMNSGVIRNQILSSMDLFTGVGGITHALSGICKPRLYCEIDKPCRNVLKARINDGSLPNAPIIKDVRNITIKSLTEAPYKINKGDIDIVVGGFPCQGFSNMGNKTGLEHVQSGLYSEIIRIVDEFGPKAVFLENVPNVLKVMFDQLRTDFHSRGFCLAWTVVPASLIGAPHERARWFCLAFKPLEFNLDIKNGLAYKRYPWQNPKIGTPVRMITLANKTDKHINNQRMGMLGNSVVPDAVRFAFLGLVTGYRHTDLECKSLRFSLMKDIKGLHNPHHGTQSRSLMVTSKDTPRNGVSVCVGPPKLKSYVTLRLKRSLQVLKALKDSHKPVGLVLDPRYNTVTQHSRDISPGRLLQQRTPIRQWSTPRHGNVAPSRHLTVRTVRDLATQIRFEVNTPDKDRYGDVNAQFVEHMMGYPLGWTRS